MIEIDRDRLIEIKRWTSSYDEHANALLPDNSLYATSERSGFFYSTMPMNASVNEATALWTSLINTRY